MSVAPARPTFLVIGAQKSGTTSLAAALRRHPDVFVPKTKELHFFSASTNYERGIDWYQGCFEEAEQATAVGEATPEYLYQNDVPGRVAEHFADLRFVVLLRNPVDRAYSHYLHAQRTGHTGLSFEAALAEEDRKLGQGKYGWWSFVDRGRYLRQLVRWERRFGREALHVELFEDLVRDPAVVCGRIAEFIGVDASATDFSKLPRQNPAQRSIVPLPSVRRRIAHLPRGDLRRQLIRWTNRPSKARPMHPDTRAALQARFRRENEALGDWLGRPLREWA